MNENTTEGPLTATVGERLGEKGREVAHDVQAPHREAHASRDHGRGRFPWPALLAAAAVWLLVTGLTRGVGRRTRAIGRRFRRRR
jgi:hypothetical protein